MNEIVIVKVHRPFLFLAFSSLDGKLACRASKDFVRVRTHEAPSLRRHEIWCKSRQGHTLQDTEFHSKFSRKYKSMVEQMSRDFIMQPRCWAS
jgi:hypothetical protein